MLSCFFLKKNKKKIAKGLDRTVLTGSCGLTLVLAVHGINKKSGSLGLKNQFSSQFSVFTVRPPDPVRFWKPWVSGLYFPRKVGMLDFTDLLPFKHCVDKFLKSCELVINNQTKIQQSQIPNSQVPHLY